MTKKDASGYKLQLNGPGITVSRPVGAGIAQQILALVMGEGVLDSPGSLAGHGPTKADASSPKAFMTSKRPTTDIEKVVCLAYFLSHQRRVQGFKTKELTELNIEAAQPRLSNPSATARNAVSDGFLSLLGGGQKQITTRGEALVEALPDRDKVKGVLAEHPLRRTRKRRSRGQLKK